MYKLCGFGKLDHRFYVSVWRHGKAANGEGSMVTKTEFYSTLEAQQHRINGLRNSPLGSVI